MAERLRNAHVWMRANRFYFLLISIVLFMVLRPFAEGLAGISLLMEVFVSAVLLSGIYAVSEDRISLVLAMLTGLPAMFFHWFSQILKIPALLVMHQICGALFFGVAAIIIIRHLFHDRDVTADRIWGAVCGYFLIGFMWADIFCLLEGIHPGSFNLGEMEAVERHDFIYFSFVSLTTVGYGDITPLTQQARALSILEAVMGQMYLAVNIAALVAIRITTRISQSRNEHPGHGAKMDKPVSSPE